MTTISILSTDVQKQILLLRQYPEIAKRHYVPAIKAATKLLAATIRPNIPQATGKAAGTFGSKVTSKGLGSSSGGFINVTGRVGWYDPGDPWYINVVEHGAKPHEMNTYAPGLGVYVAQHPGFSARGFMAAGYSVAKPAIEALMEAANDAVLQELKT